MVPGNPWYGECSEIPSGCSIRNGGDMLRHFEISATGVGKGRGDLIPICKNLSFPPFVEIRYVL